MKNRYQTRSIERIVPFVLAIGVFIFSVEGVFAQSNDFFSNTQSNEQRATATTPNAPGFDPCRGGGGAMSATNCDSAAALLSAANVSTNFVIAGPGAITDNMFGRVSGAALGASGAVGGAGTEVDTAITKCAPGFGTGGFDNAPVVGDPLRGLNCGDLRLAPDIQGMAIPSGSNTLGTGSAMTATTPLTLPFSGAANAFTDFTITNIFVQNPTGAQVQIDSPANLCNPNTQCGKQSITQNTFTGGASGTSGSPGLTTNQRVVFTSDFAVGLSGATQGVPTTSVSGFAVNWTSSIRQPDMINTDNTVTALFTQDIQGVFTFGAGTFDPVQYPNGPSQTIRSTGSGTPNETLP